MRARRDLFDPQVLLPLLLVGMILLHGHFVFSPLYWAYRYDAYLVGFGLFVAAVVLADLRVPGGLPRGALAAVLVAALVPLVASVGEGLVPDAEIEGMRNTYLEEYQTARVHPALLSARCRDRQRPRGGRPTTRRPGSSTSWGSATSSRVAIMRHAAYTSRDVWRGRRPTGRRSRSSSSGGVSSARSSLPSG